MINQLQKRLMDDALLYVNTKSCMARRLLGTARESHIKYPEPAPKQNAIQSAMVAMQR